MVFQPSGSVDVDTGDAEGADAAADAGDSGCVEAADAVGDVAADDMGCAVTAVVDDVTVAERRLYVPFSISAAIESISSWLPDDSSINFFLLIVTSQDRIFSFACFDTSPIETIALANLASRFIVFAFTL